MGENDFYRGMLAGAIASLEAVRDVQFPEMYYARMFIEGKVNKDCKGTLWVTRFYPDCAKRVSPEFEMSPQGLKELWRCFERLLRAWPEPDPEPDPEATDQTVR